MRLGLVACQRLPIDKRLGTVVTLERLQASGEKRRKKQDGKRNEIIIRPIRKKSCHFLLVHDVCVILEIPLPGEALLAHLTLEELQFLVHSPGN